MGRRRIGMWGTVVAMVVLCGACGDGQAGTAGADLSAATETGRDPATVLPAPTSSGPDTYDDGSALHVLLDDGRFGAFVGIIERYPVGRAKEMFSDPGHGATILAPTDGAFRGLDHDLLGAILSDEAVLTRVVKNHMVERAYRAEELAGRDELQTLGMAVPVRTADGRVTVAGVPLVDEDVDAGNSVIHVVDQLILPCEDGFLADAIGDPFTDHCRS